MQCILEIYLNELQTANFTSCRYENNYLYHVLLSDHCVFFVFHEGVRYYMRGVDSDGHVANYIETEQIIMYHEHKASFVQVRISALCVFIIAG